MRLGALTPMLRSWDLPGTIEFYTRVLGFTCQAYRADWGWASLRRDEVALMLSAPNAHEGDTAPGFTGSLYFRVDDVDAWWDRLREAARVCYAPESFEYGMREFAVYDNNGYLLQFGQELG